jgi:GNAT superfamily N-acetyltransferase
MIREATHADIPRLVEMGTRFIASTPYRTKLALNQATLTTAMQRLIDSPLAVLLVADVERHVVGMLAVVAAEHPLSGQVTAGEVFWWVDPAYRGRLGMRLLQVGEAWARARGAAVLQMIAPDDRVARLYRRRGYSKLEETYQRTL